MNLFNLIKRAIVSRKTADTGQFPIAQVEWNGKAKNIHHITPYGLYSNLPIDSLVLTFNVLGQEENMAGIGNTPKRRFKNLKEGEVAIGNPITGSVIKFLENGDIEVTGKNDQNVNITGDVNVTVGGNVNMTVTGNTLIDTTGDTTINTGGNTKIDTTGTTTIDSTGNVSSTIGGTLTADVTGNTNITTPTLALTGNLTVTGTINADGDITAISSGAAISMSAIKSTYNSHTHNENDAAPAPTGAPNSTI